VISWGWPDRSPLRELFEQMLDEQRRQVRQGRGAPMPINVHDTGREVVVEAALPGVAADKVDLDCADGLLTIRARAEYEERDYLHQELQTTDFLRQLQLPADCRFEQARAEFENGILTITVPKVQPKQPEKIRIQVTRKGPASETIEAKPGDGYSEVKPKKKGS
jgi:HSP20 family protein